MSRRKQRRVHPDYLPGGRYYTTRNPWLSLLQGLILAAGAVMLLKLFGSGEVDVGEVEGGLSLWFVGLVLLCGLVFLRAVLQRKIGFFGMVISLLAVGLIIWSMKFGWLPTNGQPNPCPGQHGIIVQVDGECIEWGR